MNVNIPILNNYGLILKFRTRTVSISIDISVEHPLKILIRAWDFLRFPMTSMMTSLHIYPNLPGHANEAYVSNKFGKTPSLRSRRDSLLARSHLSQTLPLFSNLSILLLTPSHRTIQSALPQLNYLIVCTKLFERQAAGVCRSLVLLIPTRTNWWRKILSTRLNFGLSWKQCRLKNL